MISTLADTPFEEIHDAFVDAFSEYEIKIDMPMERLREMLQIRSCHLEYSLGHFENGRLLGFFLVGYRDTVEGKRFYDVATGVRKEAQGKGIGQAMITSAKSLMAEQGVAELILEVLENNIGAQELYRRNGFQTTRRFNCYEWTRGGDDAYPEAAAAPAPATDDQKHLSFLGTLPVSELCSFEPSWQNALASYYNAPERFRIVIERKNAVPIGYGIVHHENGSILQLGIKPSARSVEPLTQLLRKLQSCTTSETLRYPNVEAGSAVDTLLQAAGCNRYVGQLEMSYRPACAGDTLGSY